MARAAVGLMALGVAAGCANSAATPTGSSSTSIGAPAASATAAATPQALSIAQTPSAVLLAAETLHADEAAVVSGELKAAARAARNAQTAVGKALSAYDASLSSVGCSASTAAYGSALASLRSAVATYQERLAASAKIESRLQADADAVTAAAKKAGITVPVDLTNIRKSFAGYKEDAASRAAAITAFVTRAQNAHGRCIYKLEHPRRH